MKQQHWLGGSLIVAALVSTAVAIAAGGTGIYINDRLASSRVRIIDGTPYAPIADIAKAYGAQVIRRPDGDFQIAAAGGANQVGRFQGKTGEEIFTGQFRFSVLSVEEPVSYTTQFLANAHTVTPESPNQKLIVVHCRIRNGTPNRQQLLMAVGGEHGSPNTALADSSGQSFAPINWHGNEFSGVDVQDDETTPLGTSILPGAAATVNLVFLVPSGTHAKDLVFSLTLYDQYSKADKKKFVDVRVALTNP